MSLRRLARRYPFRYAKMLSSRYEIDRYLRTHKVRLLNIGAQLNRPRGWLNVDLLPGFGTVYLDATRMASLPSGSFDAVLCEHMIEHVPKTAGAAICRQMRRIMKPEGVARVVTPDAERLFRLVLGPGSAERRYLELFRALVGEPGMSDLDAVNIAFRNYGHQYLYTRQQMTATLRAAGFTRIQETKPSGFHDALFADAQGHGRLVGDELNDLEAFAFEAAP
jgi:hypothetical protein